MAMMASKGPVAAEVDADVISAVRSAVELPSRSPAEAPAPEEEDCTWEAAYRLRVSISIERKGTGIW